MKNYHLITYIEMPRPNVLKRILTSDRIDPTIFLTGMNKLAYPIAISGLTKKQFSNMKKAFPTIEVIE